MCLLHPLSHLLQQQLLARLLKSQEYLTDLLNVCIVLLEKMGCHAEELVSAARPHQNLFPFPPCLPTVLAFAHIDYQSLEAKSVPHFIPKSPGFWEGSCGLGVLSLPKHPLVSQSYRNTFSFCLLISLIFAAMPNEH